MIGKNRLSDDELFWLIDKLELMRKAPGGLAESILGKLKNERRQRNHAVPLAIQGEGIKPTICRPDPALPSKRLDSCLDGAGVLAALGLKSKAA